MQQRFIESARTVLTIAGLVLLVIFGAKAAAQADNMKIAGGKNSNFPMFLIQKLHSFADMADGAQGYSAVSKVSTSGTRDTATSVNSAADRPVGQTTSADTSPQPTAEPAGTTVGPSPAAEQASETGNNRAATTPAPGQVKKAARQHQQTGNTPDAQSQAPGTPDTGHGKPQPQSD